ncbi:MAG6090-like repeat-containing lipoprotein [Mycoplasmopsis bovis]|uniref:MAG6090-like repeat-containing lipoprotein n=1 Tax=Mycoplasmopsis bovis TaxID=28903 RepID=UPI003D1B7176
MNTYRDSISGLDIELHPTGEQIKKEEKRLADKVKKILDQNLKNNKVFWAEVAASNSTAKIFDDTYTDQKNKVLDKQKRREQDEARRQYYHKYQSSDATMRLFDDEYTDLVEEALTRQMYREQEAYFKGLMHEYYSAAHTKDLFELLTKQIDHKSNKKAEFRKQIEKLTAEKLKLEKEFAELETKSEKEEERLRESYESQLVQVVDAYEEEKALLVKQRDLINKKISDLLTKQDEINKSKAGIQDVKDLIEALRDAESSNKKYQDFIDDLETKIKEADELSAKTMDLERKIEELRSLISSSWQEQKDKAEKSWKEEKVKTESIQKDLEKELKEVEEESKTLKRLKRDLTENFSDSFFINPNENEGFNHQIIEEIDKDILIAEHEKKELYALVAEVNKKVLEKAYIYCELLNAEGKLKILEQYNKKLQKQMNEISAYVAENSLKRSSAEELAKLFADNIEKLQEFILKSLQASQSVSEHEQTLELLESEKDSINKSLDELESRFEKQKTNLLDNLDESILDLSFEYEDLEELKLEEIKEKEAQIKQNEESIQKLKK